MYKSKPFFAFPCVALGLVISPSAAYLCHCLYNIDVIYPIFCGWPDLSRGNALLPKVAGSFAKREKSLSARGEQAFLVTLLAGG